MGREKHERLDPARLAEEWALPRASNGLQMESPGSGIGGSMLLTVRGSSHSAQRHVWGPSSNADAHVQRKAMHSQVPMMASVLMESSTLGALRRQSTGFADGIFGRESAGLPGQARSLGWLGVGQGAAPIPDDVLGAGGPAMVGSAPIKGTGEMRRRAWLAAEVRQRRMHSVRRCHLAQGLPRARR